MRARDAARELVRATRRLWEAGLIAGGDGNLSVRLGPDRLLVTPRGLPKSDLQPADCVEVGLDGRHRRGSRRASTELDLHLRVYRARPDVGAVVHAHPPTATAFTVAGLPLDDGILPEQVVCLGRVGVVPYARPGTPALGDAVAPLAAAHDVVLLANHGAAAWAATLDDARIRMESLEHVARIIWAARALGPPRPLAAGEVAALLSLRERRADG